MAHEISYNNFELSLVVFMPNITKKHAITYILILLHEKFLQFDWRRAVVFQLNWNTYM